MKVAVKVPKWAMKGAEMLGFSFASGYESARTNSPRRGALSTGQPRDHKLDLPGYSRINILRRSREIFRNSGYKRESVATLGSFAIGEGLRPQSLAEDKDAGLIYEELWRKFSMQPTVCGRHNMTAIQYLISRALDVDGEIFIIKTKDRFNNPKIQILESHQISSHTDEEKRIWDGIQVDARNRPTFYHQVIQDKKNPARSKTKAIPARSVLHVFDPESPSAVRGIPAGQAGLNALQDVGELLAFETHATKQAAELGLVVKSDRVDALVDGDFKIDSEEDEPGTDDGDAKGADDAAIAAAMGGRVVRLDIGETLESFRSDRPSQTFHGHLEELHRESSGGGLPYEVLRDASKVGGASVRMVASKVDRVVRYRQNIITSRALDHMWAYCIGFGIEHEPGTPAVKSWQKVRWVTPRRITVDAGREAQQARQDVELGIETIANHLGERGAEFDDWLSARTDQARKMMTAAGHPESDPIPMWMIYKPQGISFSPEGAEQTPPMEKI